MTRVYILNIEQLRPKNIFDRYFEQTSSYRRKKIEAAKKEKDKLRSLGVGVLTDKYLQTKGLREKDMVYGTGVNGKPYFERTVSCESDFEASICKGIYFNASHSGDYVVCAFSDKPVGCDVETADKKNLRVAERYFCPEEIRYIFDENGFESSKNKPAFQENETVVVYESAENSLCAVRIERFVRVWTIKEAYLKLLGTGLTKALDSFEIKGLSESEIAIWDKEFPAQSDYETEYKTCSDFGMGNKKECIIEEIKKADCKISEIVLDNARVAICSSDKNVSYSMFF